MYQHTLLYLFSTLAQTCAALAAFVGAVGVLRLRRRSADRQKIGLTRRLAAL
jgi:ABC-type nickel/cobalt efflux system permease component RcnA